MAHQTVGTTEHQLVPFSDHQAAGKIFTKLPVHQEYAVKREKSQHQTCIPEEEGQGPVTPGSKVGETDIEHNSSKQRDTEDTTDQKKKQSLLPAEHPVANISRHNAEIEPHDTQQRKNYDKGNQEKQPRINTPYPSFLFEQRLFRHAKISLSRPEPEPPDEPLEPEPETPGPVEPGEPAS